MRLSHWHPSWPQHKTRNDDNQMLQYVTDSDDTKYKGWHKTMDVEFTMEEVEGGKWQATRGDEERIIVLFAKVGHLIIKFPVVRLNWFAGMGFLEVEGWNNIDGRTCLSQEKEKTKVFEESFETEELSFNHEIKWWQFILLPRIQIMDRWIRLPRNRDRDNTIIKPQPIRTCQWPRKRCGRECRRSEREWINFIDFPQPLFTVWVVGLETRKGIKSPILGVSANNR